MTGRPAHEELNLLQLLSSAVVFPCCEGAGKKTSRQDWVCCWEVCCRCVGRGIYSSIQEHHTFWVDRAFLVGVPNCVELPVRVLMTETAHTLVALPKYGGGSKYCKVEQHGKLMYGQYLP